MKELFKAQQIHDKVVRLDKEIIKLEKSLDNVIRNNEKGNIKLSFNTGKKEKLELDEDGSIVNKKDTYEPYNLSFAIFARGVMSDDKNDKYNDGYSDELDESELMLMLGTLLRYKQDKRKSLISEFNELSLRLKI